MKLIQQSFQIGKQQAGNRLDNALHRLLPEYSRARIQSWIQQGFVSVNDELCKSRQKVVDGDLVDLDVPEQIRISDRPQAVDFEILYQDEDIIVVNKPANLVVHPAAGHLDGTLVNGLLAHESRLGQLPRAGIVHRLDKDTTGVMVVARNLTAHSWLIEQLQQRLIKREYVAIAQGVVTAGRSIDASIGRHPQNRKKMSVQAGGKPAITHFQVARKFNHYSLIKIQLETGRTHQIRVHMAYINYPLLGDRVYGGRQRIPAGIHEALRPVIRDFSRQALHAERLSFEHPRSHEPVSFEAPLPGDFENLLESLIQYD
ncbi:MAG: 23S rRNA pseudouridine(1911/1915/1917) synthase RluD [Gammaproteobacteria bacterium]|nr:23S rRNA pseudouridine(1911/1915/1917) synthase RluD [Gammaproteobacteria bacterium]MDH3856950.1 23S rRNA pseudouridine(1911/1915/1917) synthase RluD [Gammaproteobacteria bacterium]